MVNEFRKEKKMEENKVPVMASNATGGENAAGMIIAHETVAPGVTGTVESFEPVVRQPEMTDVLQALMAQVGQLAKEVSDLRRSGSGNTPFAGQPAGAPPRAEGINPGFDKVKGYIKQNRGYPVQPGQTWHDLTAAQRKEWFQNHENRWKQAYSKSASKFGSGGSMDWTRG